MKVIVVIALLVFMWAAGWHFTHTQTGHNFYCTGRVDKFDVACRTYHHKN